ncbi:tRNA threonylcarbamoyladenosine biosynthesis protein [Candidatus Photodesmus blepharus]|uniref:Threonylcarbamoyl-AMP synthase n=1 Tax=Candidatus Photodesmus blepharonis TaxID=1179155 RepID=A0A084CNE1_9GAMM|nr:Sua5/YciO/YrdC/YwlC family protein [Candidatus Photodesmus blepharus]KEY91320.1 tRNA threonylcarbamoyladenosine biosynthesis protein [Candidatus Photodesmus blepharus]
MRNFELALMALQKGEIIAYPTEGVFGLGCDPDNFQAIRKLLRLKQRPIEKGLILVAASYQQLLPYINESQLNQEQLKQIYDSWPGPVTWVMPPSILVSTYLSGKFSSIAVRVTDHPVAQIMCYVFGKPLVSTSANLSGESPCTSSSEVKRQFGDKSVTILEGKVGNPGKITTIRDAKTAKILRVC